MTFNVPLTHKSTDSFFIALFEVGLEKVLNLSSDILTKEFRLTQDLMRLFTEYQKPTNLMSFEGSASATFAAELLVTVNTTYAGRVECSRGGRYLSTSSRPPFIGQHQRPLGPREYLAVEYTQVLTTTATIFDQSLMDALIEGNVSIIASILPSAPVNHEQIT
eukprot:gene37185-45873_t